MVTIRVHLKDVDSAEAPWSTAGAISTDPSGQHIARSINSHMAISPTRREEDICNVIADRASRVPSPNYRPNAEFTTIVATGEDRNDRCQDV